MKAMSKVIALGIVLVACAGAAFAQPAAGAAAPGGAAALPATGEPAVPAAVPDAPPSAARKACTDAMNADPTFAAAIVKVADAAAARRRDDDTLKAHNAANAQVQENERHVIYAYAAMWIVAAGFVVFLWRRQQALKDEIGNLRRDLEAAAEDATSAQAKS